MELRAILTPKVALAGVVALLAGGVAACGDARGPVSSGGPSIVVSTSVLGDVVDNLVGDQADVEVLMPRGADPHEASLSSRQADDMSRADLVVVNGAGFEQGMRRVVDSVQADGTPVFAVADHVDLLTFAEEHERQEAAAEARGPDGEEHGAAGEHEDGGGDASGDGHGHDDGDVDPHVWTDPTRMATATQALSDRLATLDGIDADAVERATAGYLSHLAALDAEVAEVLAPIPAERRILVTNHEVFGYFADRYGFRVVGAVIPAGTTQAEPSSSEVAALADVIVDTGVPAIFAETSSPAGLAEALAADAGDVEVVSLFSESLGDAGSGGATYLQMMRTNADRIAEALT
jgi:zinc/manganese transport system substrate-binding protein